MRRRSLQHQYKTHKSQGIRTITLTGKIFISYSKKVKDFAWKLADDLLNASHKVWINRSLQVGDHQKESEEANEIIVLPSSNAIASNQYQ